MNGIEAVIVLTLIILKYGALSNEVTLNCIVAKHKGALTGVRCLSFPP